MSVYWIQEIRVNLTELLFGLYINEARSVHCTLGIRLHIPDKTGELQTITKFCKQISNPLLWNQPYIVSNCRMSFAFVPCGRTVNELPNDVSSDGKPGRMAAHHGEAGWQLSYDSVVDSLALTSPSKSALLRSCQSNFRGNSASCSIPHIWEETVG